MHKMERRTGMKLVVKIPEGWSIYFMGRKAVAIHPEHKPRFTFVDRIGVYPFEQWPELMAFDRDEVRVEYSG